MVVPDEEQTAAGVGVPGARLGQLGGSLGVRHQFAAAVTAPAPVVERAGHLIALDGALRQVPAHVPAVAVEHVHVACGVGEDDQLGAEGVHRVWAAVRELLHRSQTVPAAGVPVRQGAGVDLADVGGHCAASTFRVL